MRFTTTIEQTGKTTTGIVVPPDVVDALAAGKRPAVTVTVGAHTYRSTIASMGGRHLISLSAENRAAAGVGGGDVVEVVVELDTAPREVEIAPDVAAALAADSVAAARFEKLSYSHKRQHVLAVEGAKTQATRERRIAKMIDQLRI